VQTIRLQDQQVKEQMATIGKLTDAPVQRTESIWVVNPEWQLVNQAYNAQKGTCNGLDNQLASLLSEIQRIKGGERGAYYGAAIAIALVLSLAATRYDTRKRNPLGATFAISSLSLLIGMGIVGYWIGKNVHNQLIASDKNLSAELAHLEQRRSELELKIADEQEKLDKRQRELLKLNQYNSETVTTVEEARVLP
jgi:hypothetical protein